MERVAYSGLYNFSLFLMERVTFGGPCNFLFPCGKSGLQWRILFLPFLMEGVAYGDLFVSLPIFLLVVKAVVYNALFIFGPLSLFFAGRVAYSGLLFTY